MKAGLAGHLDIGCAHILQPLCPWNGLWGSSADARLRMVNARGFLPVGQVRGLQGLVTPRGSLLLGLKVNVNKEQVEVGSGKEVSEPNA